MNLKTAINNGYQKLKDNNIKTALLDSEILLSEAIDKTREFIILNNQNIIHQDDYKCYQNMIAQRAKGKPVAYLTNKKFFWNFIVKNGWVQSMHQK